MTYWLKTFRNLTITSILAISFNSAQGVDDFGDVTSDAGDTKVTVSGSVTDADTGRH